jgi:hypothetical protein
VSCSQLCTKPDDASKAISNSINSCAKPDVMKGTTCSSRGNKTPYGLRKVLQSNPSSVPEANRFPVSSLERRYYGVFCRLGLSDRYQWYIYVLFWFIIVNSYFLQFSVAQKKLFHHIVLSFICYRCLNSMTAIIYRKVRCSYLSLGQSLMPRGHINNFLISVLCRKLYDDCHPSISKKHYFFSYIGVIILFISSSMCFKI